MPDVKAPRPPIVLWRWRLRNAKAAGGRTLRWAMTETDAAVWARTNKVEIEKVPGSREERQPPEMATGGTRSLLPGNKR